MPRRGSAQPQPWKQSSQHHPLQNRAPPPPLLWRRNGPKPETAATSPDAERMPTVTVKCVWIASVPLLTSCLPAFKEAPSPSFPLPKRWKEPRSPSILPLCQPRNRVPVRLPCLRLLGPLQEWVWSRRWRRGRECGDLGFISGDWSWVLAWFLQRNSDFLGGFLGF